MIIPTPDSPQVYAVALQYDSKIAHELFAVYNTWIA